jgi:hypothetical protein
MQTKSPICLMLEKQPGNTEPVSLFGWELDKENAVIKITENKETSIETMYGTSVSYKDVMLDIIGSEPLKVVKTYISGQRELLELGRIAVIMRTKEGSTMIKEMLMCDYLSLFQYRDNIIIIENEFWIRPNVEIILKNLIGKTQTLFFAKHHLPLDERFNSLKLGNDNPIDAAYKEMDIKKGCGSWIILANKTDTRQAVKFVRQNTFVERGGSIISDDMQFPVIIGIENENVEIVSSTPFITPPNPKQFIVYPDMPILHKIYSNSCAQVQIPIKVFRENRIDDMVFPLSPFQVNPRLVRWDLDLGKLIKDKQQGQEIIEFELMPNTNLVMFFSEMEKSSEVVVR